ncbi:uncharacterized protein L201_003265 [Kwoniella dendrophila CBS 6074]|uniref:Ataxin-10 domain-containing protein n=1 Tax=Kwoniella dendrophila CBS 6074 TaxID=1295534 RepID=A0AAX4JUW7_9TREE
MPTSRSLLASGYANIDKRGEKLDSVRKELNLVINALPTQIHPSERELYLKAILDDLSDRDDAPWTVWPQDVYMLALTAIKSLGRNPVGSETLLSSEQFSILLHHSGLPIQSTFSPSRSSPTPFSLPARETLKILANLLVLHEEGRNKFASSSGAKAVARALARKDINGDGITYEKEEDNTERLFLLGRLGFLVTINRSRAVGVMVDTENIVDSLVQQFTNLQPAVANHMALSELLKLTNNIIRFYPYSTPSSADSDQWDSKFDPLLYPILCQFYGISFIDLSPPLSHAIHALLSIPFVTRLLPTWHSIPIPPSPTPIAGSASPTSSMKNLLNRISHMSTSQNTNKKSSTPPSESLIPPIRRRTPSPTSSRRSSNESCSNKKPTVLPPSTQDVSALSSRLLRIFDHFFEVYLPWPKKPDDTLPQGLVLDEMLPPLLLLLTRAAAGSEAIRKHVKETLLPANLDRSPEAGPLESRKGALGDILRLMGCAGHTQSKNTAGELMWAICNNDPADLCVEIGYGNAAGILFQKGLSGPPPAKIEEIPTDQPIARISSDNSSNTSINIQPATPTVPLYSQAQAQISSSGIRNPITSLSNTTLENDKDEMTEEEKEREAEKLFTIFERLEKNPVISMNQKSESNGEEKKVNIQDIMREKLNTGSFEQEDIQDHLNELKRLKEQDEKDELDAIKEIEEYKKRIGKK